MKTGIRKKTGIRNKMGRMKYLVEHYQVAETHGVGVVLCGNKKWGSAGSNESDVTCLNCLRILKEQKIS